MKKLVFALHGFLGEQGDWDFLRKHIPPHWRLMVPDYTRIPGLSPASGGIETWGSQFIGWKRSVYGDASFVLIGYSQGGRLAMTALAEEAPECMGGAVISANPGIDEPDRAARLKHDQSWALRFRQDEISAVLKDWDAQPVLKTFGKTPERDFQNFDREIVAECLAAWSLARQPDLRIWASQTAKPMLWVTGEKDEKYNLLAQPILLKSPLSKKHIMSGSGHRVLVDKPEELGKIFSQFLEVLAGESNKSGMMN